MEKVIRKNLDYDGEIIFSSHHESHAASAFYPSPYGESAILTLDGVGEWTTASVGFGKEGALFSLWSQDFPHSLGLLYSAFTAYLGFKVNSGEHKMMGLSSFGDPSYQDTIFKNLIDLAGDGSFRLNMEYFDLLSGRAMTNELFHDLFEGPPRVPEGPITSREENIASSVQAVTEKVVLRMAQFARMETGFDKLCIAGGVGLNCVANGRILREGPFKKIWVQPASGDAGGALGAALLGWYSYLGNERIIEGYGDRMHGSYLGPNYGETEIRALIQSLDIQFKELDFENKGLDSVAELLDEGKVIGWYQGGMEFGPRALGNRSILADPRDPAMPDRINRTIKFREPFRPFAPSILAERAEEYFDISSASPYMLFTGRVKRKEEVPAITHVDGSARIQTVSQESNPLFHSLLKAFEKRTSCPAILNTSLNVRGEPIVCTPRDALNCLCNSGLDALVLGSFLIFRNDLHIDDLRERLVSETGSGSKQTYSNVALRKFALQLSLPLLFMTLLSFTVPLFKGIKYFSGPMLLFVLALGILKPSLLFHLKSLMTSYGKALARSQTRLLLRVVFVVLIIPLGRVKKLLGWDPFAQKQDTGESYWKKGTQNYTADQYRRLF
jgi:carbamoyltransferase